MLQLYYHLHIVLHDMAHDEADQDMLLDDAQEAPADPLLITARDNQQRYTRLALLRGALLQSCHVDLSMSAEEQALLADHPLFDNPLGAWNASDTLYFEEQLVQIVSLRAAGCPSTSEPFRLCLSSDRSAGVDGVDVRSSGGIYTHRLPIPTAATVGDLTLRLPPPDDIVLFNPIWQLPQPAYTNLAKTWGLGEAPVRQISVGYEVAGWQFTALRLPFTDASGRVPLNLLSIPDIIQEVQAILQSGIITTEFGDKSFGAWKMDIRLQYVVTMLAKSGDQWDAAADGLQMRVCAAAAAGPPPLLFFVRIHDLLVMITDLRSAVDKKIGDLHLKDKLVRCGAFKAVGAPGEATTAGCAIYERINPSNNFSSKLMEDDYQGSLHLYLLSFNLTELGRFAVVLGGEAMSRRLLALYADVMNKHPVVVAAAADHARQVDQARPVLAEQLRRWQAGAAISDPLADSIWLGMLMCPCPERPGLYTPTSTVLLAELVRIMGIMGAPFVAAIKECKQHMAQICVFLVTAKRTNCLVPPLPGYQFEKALYFERVHFECLLSVELQVMLQTAGYSDNPSCKRELIRRIVVIRRDDIWSGEPETLNFRWPHMSITEQYICYSELRKCRWLSRATLIREITHLGGNYSDISIGSVGSDERTMWDSIREGYLGGEVPGCPITHTLPLNNLLHRGTSFATNLSFQSRLSQPILAKTLHSLYNRRMQEYSGNRAGLKAAIASGYFPPGGSAA